MPYVNVRLVKGATATQKRAVIAGITEVLVNVLGKNPDNTFVVIDDIAPEDWGWKGTSVAELNKAAPKPRAKSPPKARKA